MCALVARNRAPVTLVPDESSLTADAMDLLAIADPREIRSRLVRLGLDQTGADRCTLTSVDQGVLRVEDSHEWGRRPAFVGQEYSLSYLETQPLLQQAVSTAQVVTGGGFSGQGQTAPELTRSLSDVKRTAIVPLKLGADVGAMLILSRREDRPFHDSDLARLYAIGNLAVLALHNARLLEGVNAAQRRGLDTLTLISEHAAAIDCLPDFFGRMTATVAGLAGAAAAAYWVVHGDRISAEPDAYGFTSMQLASMSIPMATALRSGLRPVMYGGKALWSQHAGDGAAPHSFAIAPPGTRNFLAVPWRTSQGPLGMLVAYDSPTGFAAEDEWIMRLSARSSALVWQSHIAQQRVSELQAAELERLQLHSQRMAAVERQKSDFLKLASHELRGPIAIVRGYLSMMTDGTIGDVRPSVCEMTSRMQSQMLRIKELVDQMLAAARLQETGMPTSAAELRVDEVARDVVASVEPSLAASRRLIVDAACPATALADRGHVETIVSNLLSNAVKYSPDGGDIVIRVREGADDVELDVSDQGIGIAPANRARLFQPFIRGDEAELRAIDGAGLGLYLARQLARAQGGDVTVRSEHGQGSVFTVRLPRARALG